MQLDHAEPATKQAGALMLVIHAVIPCTSCRPQCSFPLPHSHALATPATPIRQFQTYAVLHHCSTSIVCSQHSLQCGRPVRALPAGCQGHGHQPPSHESLGVCDVSSRGQPQQAEAWCCLKHEGTSSKPKPDMCMVWYGMSNRSPVAHLADSPMLQCSTGRSVCVVSFDLITVPS
jgi:hypothetical protein